MAWVYKTKPLAKQELHSDDVGVEVPRHSETKIAKFAVPLL